MIRTKRNTAVIATMLSLSIIILSYIYIYSLRDRNTFQLKDKKGDRTALSDFVITGCLQDRYHGSEFEVADGKITHQFMYYDNTNNIRPYWQGIDSHLQGEYRYSSYYRYNIAKDANIRKEYREEEILQPLGDGTKIEATKRITTTYADKIAVDMTLNRINSEFASRRKQRYSEENLLLFKTDIYAKSEEMDFIFEREEILHSGGLQSSSDNSIKELELPNNANDLTEIEGRQYITEVTFTDPEFKRRWAGEAGIYIVEEYGYWYGEEETGKVRKIASIDLDEGRNQILGLHGVDDKLVLILIEDGVLTFRLYEPDNGGLMGELPVPQLEIDGNMCLYNAYIDGNALTLDFTDRYINSENPRRGRDSLKLISVEVANSLKLLHCIDNFDLGNRVVVNIANMVPMNGKLTVIARLQDKAGYKMEGMGLRDEFLYSQFLYPIEHTIFVFDSSRAGELIYEGEIITDAHEDKYEFRYGVDKNIDYDISDRHRGIADIQVRGVETHD